MLRIKKLDIFVLKSFLLLFAGTFFICLFIFMMQFLWRYVDELVGKGLEIKVLAQFFFLGTDTDSIITSSGYPAGCPDDIRKLRRAL